MNRKFLQEAIADAKAVKESAIANAKVALEEAFSPQLQAMFASKLEEMEVEDQKVEEEIEETNEINESEDIQFTKSDVLRVLGYDIERSEDEEDEEMLSILRDYKQKLKNAKDDHSTLEGILDDLDSALSREFGDDFDIIGSYISTIKNEKNQNEEINLDEILAELEKDEMDESKEDITEAEETEEEEIDDESEKDESEMDLDDEEIDLEDMSENDLKKFIEEVIADMVEAGELEAGEETEGEEEEMDMEDEIDIESETEEETEITEKSKEDDKMMEMKSDLEESIKVIKTLKSELNEINLLNAKLLYTNKIFKTKNMTESQKTKVLGAFDKASDVKAVKLVFETISENFTSTKNPVRESLRGSASKSTIVPETTKKPIMESDVMVQRFQKLAGII